MMSFTEIVTFLNQQFPRTGAAKFPAERGMARTRFLLHELGDPQERLKIIHVAGTSGKGSTCYLTSLLLQAHGFKVGLAVSPHITDLRERCQINGELPAEDAFVDLFSRFLPAVERTTASPHGAPTFFEIMAAFAYWAFDQQGVDYAVVETGLGGLYDPTNMSERRDKLVLLTKIGLDHTKILGRTLSEIAYQKAMIIQAGNKAFATDQPMRVRRTIELVAREQGGVVSFLPSGSVIRNAHTSTAGTRFDYSFAGYALRDVELGLLGEHQAENCSLAITALFALSARDGFSVSEERLRTALRDALFPGRMTVLRKDGRLIIVDAAHNAQKMRALTKILGQLYPGAPFTFVLPIRGERDHLAAVGVVAGAAASIIFTDPLGYREASPRLASHRRRIEQRLSACGFTQYTFIEKPGQAFDAALRLPHPIAITGSFPLLRELYPLAQRLAQ